MQKLKETWLESLKTPRQFFSRDDFNHDASLDGAWIYLSVLAAIQSVIGGVIGYWGLQSLAQDERLSKVLDIIPEQFLGLASTLVGLMKSGQLGFWSALMGIILAPLGAIIGAAFHAFSMRLFKNLFVSESVRGEGSDEVSWSGLVKLHVYSYGTWSVFIPIFSLIPFIGWILQSTCAWYVHTIGISTRYKISMTRAGLYSIGPSILLGGIIAAIGLMICIGLFLAFKSLFGL